MSDLTVLQAWLGKVKKQLERAEEKCGPFGPHMVALSHLEASRGLLRAMITEGGADGD